MRVTDVSEESGRIWEAREEAWKEAADKVGAPVTIEPLPCDQVRLTGPKRTLVVYVRPDAPNVYQALRDAIAHAR